MVLSRLRTNALSGPTGPTGFFALDFLTQSGDAKTDAAQQQLGWRPKSLEAGMQKYMRDRKRLLVLLQDAATPAAAVPA